MALTDVYDIQHHMTYQGRSVLNSYQALRANPSEGALTISDGFQNSVLPAIRAWQSDEVINDKLVIKNLGNPLDFADASLTGATGNRAGADAPTFTAGELRFPRLRSDMRNGYKRYAGMLDTDNSEDNLVASAITLLNAIGTALVGNWLSSIDSHHICNFIIVKRVCDSTPPPGDPCPQYRLPETDAELVFYQPTQGIALGTVRTQVSRRAPST